jgi:hypothetical protein
MWTDLPPVLLAELEKPDNLDILEELQDAEFASRQHYSRATYAEGCHGPLCRKAERDRGRERNEKRAAAKGRIYRPNENTRDAKRDGLLLFVIEWHLNHPEEVQRRLQARSAS